MLETPAHTPRNPDDHILVQQLEKVVNKILSALPDTDDYKNVRYLLQKIWIKKQPENFTARKITVASSIPCYAKHLVQVGGLSFSFREPVDGIDEYNKKVLDLVEERRQGYTFGNIVISRDTKSNTTLIPQEGYLISGVESDEETKTNPGTFSINLTLTNSTDQSQEVYILKIHNADSTSLDFQLGMINENSEHLTQKIFKRAQELAWIEIPKGGVSIKIPTVPPYIRTIGVL